MPTPAYSGRKSQYIFHNKFSSILFVPEGIMFNDVTNPDETQKVYIREAASLNFKPFGDKDVIERNLAHGVAVEGKIQSLQTTLAELKNWYLMSGGLINASFCMDGFYLNFVDNTGGQDPVGGTAPATGSALMGMLPTYSVDDQKAMIELLVKTELWDGEEDYCFDSSSTAAVPTLTTTATPLGLTATTDSRAANRRGGLVDLTIGGQSIGIRKKGFKFELKGVSSANDHKDRPICDFFDWTMTFVARQQKSDMKVARYFSVTDTPIIATLAGGYTIKADSGSFGLFNEHVVDEKDSYVSYTIGGRCSRNVSELTPDSIDIGVTLATQLELKKLY